LLHIKYLKAKQNKLRPWIFIIELLTFLKYLYNLINYIVSNKINYNETIDGKNLNIYSKLIQIVIS